MAITSKFLKGIEAEARPIIERQMNDAKIIAGLRDVVAAAGGDWGALKALIKARVEDDNDETGEGKRVRKIREKADCIVAYDDMLGSNMNEKNFSASQSYAEAKGGERPTFTVTPEAKQVMAAYRANEAKRGELTDTQEQPETDEPCDCSERVKPGEYYHCPKCDTEWFPEEDNSPSPETPQVIADEEASPPAASSAPLPNPQPTSSPDADMAGEPQDRNEPVSGSPASQFNNPRCQHPGTCSHAHDQGSCDDCFFDWAKRPLEEQRRLWAEAMEAASETEAA